jgi:RNA polymerase sigma factor (sigma-70 family)
MTAIEKRKEEKVLRDYEKLIFKLANKSYIRYNRKYALEDVLQEAKISAIRAYRNYDPSRNTKLITHLHNYINFYLSHYFRADTGLIKIPNKALRDENKQKPELIHNDFLYDNSSDNQHPFLDNSIVDKKIQLNELLDYLSEKEKEIIKLIYIEGFTYDEVAIMYNVSRQAINNTANKSIKKLREKNLAENSL